jgi:IS6 family transposase
VAGGRNVHRNQRRVEILVPSGGFSREYAGLHAECKARREGSRAVFRKVLKAQHTQTPRVITVDQNAAYLGAMEQLKADETMAEETELRQIKYLNNIIEQDHRNIKRIVKPMMGLKSFNSARRTLSGIEAMNMIRKGQVKGISKGDSVSQIKFIEELFGVSV